jgi:signal transduction histidine kinase
MIQLQDHSNEALKAYHQYWDCYSNGDLEGFAAMLDEDFELIGTSETEVAHSKAEGIEFYKAQMQETVGKVDNRNRIMSAKAFNDLVLINEACDIFVLVEDKWTFYSIIRISTLLRETKSGWKVIQQHGSFPDMRVQEGETLAIEKITKENLELRDAIKRRTAELEIKNRELEIESALERVRSRAMAMQKSDELLQVIKTLSEQLRQLGIHAEAVSFLTDGDERGYNMWLSSPDEEFLSKIFVPRIQDRTTLMFLEAKETGKKYYSYVLSKEEKDIYFQNFFDNTVLRDYPDNGKEQVFDAPGMTTTNVLLDGIILSVSNFNTRPYSDAENEIINRIAFVFQQSYTRFLDLKKAEAQTREAQIEAALEKVRSCSQAMQSPHELMSVAQLLREEMGALGVEELETSSIYIDEKDSGQTQCWFTIRNTEDASKTVSDQMMIQLDDTWVGQQMKKFYHSQQESTSIVMQGAQRIEWIRYCEGKSALLGTSNFYGDTIPNRTYHLYKFSNGFLGAAAPGEISNESRDLLRRATAVFAFAYTRFLDLQKAEASARAAIRQASLDRVRADISSMRHASDLERITPLVFNELTTLGIPFIRCGVFIVHESDGYVDVHLSTPEGKSLAVMKLPADANELTRVSVEAWKKQEVYTQHWNKDEFVIWVKSLQEHGFIQNPQKYQGKDAPPESLDLHFVPFAQGLLYVGSEKPLAHDQIDLVKALAKSFAIAYARYEDFVQLEKAKADIENAMTELKATQSQLVQQEKLASLGQLTAGIAHEIKNPLNFINNFSDVSVELVDEVYEELLRSVNTENKDDILTILSDVKSNLNIIKQHGLRADGIVRSMLMHSRTSSGRKEPTNLNALVTENVNLAYHGMRAGNDAIQVETLLQLDDTVGEVPLIIEDFSRVILNLCSNAFDAMKEKWKKYATAELQYESAKAFGHYLPKIVVRTKRVGTSVCIEVEDNGMGIPDEIRDKILQPFFTTKKGTQGTGLGLSITNDIVNAHGGKLEIETKINSYTRFIIILN